MSGVSIIILINLLLTVLVVYLERKNKKELLIWIIVMWILPVLGFFAYILLGGRDRNKYIYIKRNSEFNKRYSELLNRWRENGEFYIGDKEKFCGLINMNIKNKNTLVTNKNECTILKSGKEKYKELFKDINCAKRSIHIEYYIIHNDIIGKKLIKLLEKKAKQGVEVRLIYDGVANFRSGEKVYKTLKVLGGKVKGYRKLGICQNSRTHRKIVIIDGKIGYTGGINIGKMYINLDKNKSPWRDTHVRLVGSSVNMLQYYFIKDWIYLSKKEKLDIDLGLLDKYFRGNTIESDMKVQIVTSGDGEEDNSMEYAYSKVISSAKKSIIIQTPYVMPDPLILKELEIASISGIDVKIMIPTIKSGPIINDVSDYFISKLLKSGIEFYKYDGYMHAKTIVIDEEITVIGSVNLDSRSLLINSELCAFFYDKEFTNKYIKILKEDFKKSIKLNEDIFNRRSNFKKIKENILSLISPIL